MSSRYPNAVPAIFPSLLLVVCSLIAVGIPASGADSLREAMALEKQGKLKEARNLYHSAAEEFRAAGDQHNLAESLSGAGYVSVSLGDYAEAIREAEEALKLRHKLHEDAKLGADLNTV